MLKKFFVHLLSVIGLFCILLSVVACDFHGPWSYYPEEREIYRGIYTYGYIVADERPRICFTKMYAIEETAADFLAFYDSAKVTVSGKFNVGEMSIELLPTSDPNCFESSEEALGVRGESYLMEAVFRWDSAGKSVHSEFSASAHIPQNFRIKNLLMPLKNGKYDDLKNEHDYLNVDFLEYPLDITLLKFVPEYDPKCGGILMTINYDNVNGGESMNTTLGNMMSAFTDKDDSTGYGGISIKSPLENYDNMGYESNIRLAGYDNLDTIFAPNMSLPGGKSVVRMYATDFAYNDYKNKLRESFEDTRVIPESNVVGGSGVFSGMVVDSIKLNVHVENMVSYKFMKGYDCSNGDGASDGKAWDTKACRLYMDEFCSDSLYRKSKACYPSNVKMAMALDSSKWSVFLPSDVSAADKDAAYGDGLKRYCVSSNFKSNKIADCSSMYEECQVSSATTNCKEYEWQWCDDRDWDFKTFPQCGTALVSRLKLQNIKSNLIEKFVKKWCEENPKDPQCGY